MILTDEGYRVLLASDGAAALDLATSEAPDLSLLDLTMPLFDAAIFCLAYRDGEGTAPVVLNTTSQLPDIEMTVAAYAAAAFIGKPFEIEELLATVARLLR